MVQQQKIEFEYLADRIDAVPLVIQWWRTIWADRMGSDAGHAAQQLRDSLSRTELPIHILATVQGRPVGTAALKLQELGDAFPDCQYWLGSVFVEPESRDRQIASLLSLRIVEIARQMNFPHLYLQTIDLDGGLYSRLGWERVEEFTHMNEHALLMLKRLQVPR